MIIHRSNRCLGAKPEVRMEEMDEGGFSGEMVLQYLVQQGFSTKGMSFMNQDHNNDDEYEDDPDGLGKTIYSFLYIMYNNQMKRS